MLTLTICLDEDRGTLVGSYCNSEGDTVNVGESCRMEYMARRNIPYYQKEGVAIDVFAQHDMDGAIYAVGHM